MCRQVVARAWRACSTVTQARQLAAELDVDERAAREDSSRGVLRCIDSALPVLLKAFEWHAIMSNVSGFSQFIAITVLAEGAQGTLDREHCKENPISGPLDSKTGVEYKTRFNINLKKTVKIPKFSSAFLIMPDFQR